jgi:acyl carrier protein
MNDDEIWTALAKVFRRVFDDEVVITEATTARDIAGWDSLNHVRLMVAVEKVFRVRFSSGEVSDLKSVGDLKKTLQEKLAAANPTRPGR